MFWDVKYSFYVHFSEFSERGYLVQEVGVDMKAEFFCAWSGKKPTAGFDKNYFLRNSE